jgi:hypothetical protein
MTLAERFIALDTLLMNTRHYWQCTAFDFDTLPWPELAPLLNALTDQQIKTFEGNQDDLYTLFIPLITQLNDLPRLCYLEKVTHNDTASYPFWISNGIKGRKFEQLQDFVSALPASEHPVLEWCAGKGHLGRMLAFNGAPSVHSIELQPDLCEQGQNSAKLQGLPMHFSQANVLTDDTAYAFNQHLHAVALHACGGLHQAFMHKACEAKTEQISFSPCCYHLFTPNTYQAMSDLAKQSDLTLTHRDLKLSLEETVTAPRRIDKVRITEVEWRLGFDALRKTITGEHHYVSVPSVGKAIFSDSFAAFCAWAANKKSIEIPADTNYEMFLSRGKTRRKITERVDLVRHVFRRAIEVWLVLDRALYLQQQGYTVRIKTFCEKQLTPRNILIAASLPSSTD